MADRYEERARALVTVIEECREWGPPARGWAVLLMDPAGDEDTFMVPYRHESREACEEYAEGVRMWVEDLLEAHERETAERIAADLESRADRLEDQGKEMASFVLASAAKDYRLTQDTEDDNG